MLSSLYITAQKRNDTSLGISLDYGFDAALNNLAYSFIFNFNLFDQLRISPTYTNFLKKENMRMNSLSLNFHYLMKETSLFNELFFKHTKYYPIFGFSIVNTSGLSSKCTVCTDRQIKFRSNSYYNFGFNFGLGGEFKLPDTEKLSINFEFIYSAVENYYRPLIRLGLLYHF